MEYSSDTIVVLVSALAAAASFIAFALPFLKSAEKKERYRSVITERRKALFEQSRDELASRGKKKQEVSARDSVATFFKVQQQLGKMGEKARTLMLQAGIRNPSAPFKFIIARFVLPILFSVFAMILISHHVHADPEHNDMSEKTKLFVLAVCAFAGFKLPVLLIKNQIQKRSQEFTITFPDALDMMLICVQGGIGLEQTVNRIAEEMAEHSEIMAEELGILSAEMAMLNDRRAALQDFARRIGSPSARSFATALIQAEQYGTSVSNAMRIMSDELREQRMAAAEQKAASLPPKLTVPMILFFLPVLFVVILGPAVLKFMQSRHSGGGGS